MTTDTAGNRYHQPGHRVYTSAGPGGTFVDGCVVRGCPWPREPDKADEPERQEAA